LRDTFQSEKRWLKAEMHAHCNLDPIDYGICRFTPKQLIREAAGRGFEILSITCHNLDIWTDSLSEYARSLGITLIPGIEVTAEKTRHILVYNIDQEADNLNTLEKIGKHVNQDTLIVAPHPFYPGHTCLREYLEQHPDLFDAVEYSGFLAPGLNFNRRGVKFAKKTGKPLLGFGDIHHLWQLGRTYTWIYAKPEIQSILSAIKQGQVRIETSPLSWLEVTQWWTTLFWEKAFPANASPKINPSYKIKNGRSLSTSQERVESQSIHVGQ